VSAVVFQCLAFLWDFLLDGLLLQKLGNHYIDCGIILFGQCAVAFAAILVGGNLSPVRYRAVSCWIFTAAGLLIYAWLFLNFLFPFERHREVHDPFYYLLTDPFLDGFTVGGVCGCLYLTLLPKKDCAPPA